MAQLWIDNSRERENEKKKKTRCQYADGGYYFSDVSYARRKNIRALIRLKWISAERSFVSADSARRKTSFQLRKVYLT